LVQIRSKHSSLTGQHLQCLSSFETSLPRVLPWAGIGERLQRKEIGLAQLAEIELTLCYRSRCSTAGLPASRWLRIIQPQPLNEEWRFNDNLMPIYEFECRKCKAHLEVFQKINDKPPVKCRKCGGRLEKQVSASAIQFKGTGWYVTDYASKGAKEKRSQDQAASAGDSGTSASDTGASASDKGESTGDKGGSAGATSAEKSEKKEASPIKRTDKASSRKSSKGD